ncbi:tyrosine--tRNA ligase, partial [Candidatus Woesearchaeota archaeon]|nr:tyrosine--tRNA ligase [Candidatus Woesearchaeota archaeon]
MDIESRIALIKQVGEEIITEEELKHLFQTKEHPTAYDGFEPSGTDIHIAQGILRAININKMAKAGIKFKMWVADWHAWANNKMGGDLEKIQQVGNYLIEVWKHCGMDLKNVEFLWANDVIKEPEYWKKVMQVARNSTVKRIIRTGQIMGRKEAEVQQASQILYPCMQAADIFHLKADICQLGMDQRKVNVLARELAPSLGFAKPVVVSHHMLIGLGEPPKEHDEDRILKLKMSKTNPDKA